MKPYSLAGAAEESIDALLDQAVTLIEPAHLTDAVHWHTHIPFAFFLTGLLRPRRLVELGTWKGDSYCAFCQAIVRSELETTASAVDTWQGDVHTGAYGSQVFEDLRAYHDPRYGQFSELVRVTFDDALARFDAGSIDLLHIDGVHVYEAVRRDFESWLPKVSGRGVVLFHDTCHRQDGFGVWRLWEELADRYPAFGFTHGYGLGVVAPGSDPDPDVLAFIDRANSDGGATRRLFEALGAGVAAIARSRGPEVKAPERPSVVRRLAPASLRKLYNALRAT